MSVKIRITLLDERVKKSETTKTDPKIRAKARNTWRTISYIMDPEHALMSHIRYSNLNSDQIINKEISGILP